jgi:hypothetical protein
MERQDLYPDDFITEANGPGEEKEKSNESGHAEGLQFSDEKG